MGKTFKHVAEQYNIKAISEDCCEINGSPMFINQPGFLKQLARITEEELYTLRYIPDQSLPLEVHPEELEPTL